MTTVKIINDGDQQVIRLPEDCHFDGSEVNIHKVGNIVFLISPENEWNGLDAAISLMDGEFKFERATVLENDRSGLT